MYEISFKKETNQRKGKKFEHLPPKLMFSNSSFTNLYPKKKGENYNNINGFTKG